DRPACRALPEVTKAPTPRGPATPRAVSAARCGCALAPHAPACTACLGESLGSPPLSPQSCLSPRQHAELAMPPTWPHPVQSPEGLQVARREKMRLKFLSMSRRNEGRYLREQQSSAEEIRPPSPFRALSCMWYLGMPSLRLVEDGWQS